MNQSNHSRVGMRGSIVVVKRNIYTGEKSVWTHRNRLSNAACRYYAQRMAEETPTEFVDGSGDPDLSFVLWESTTLGQISNPFPNINAQDGGVDDGWDAAAPYTTGSKKAVDSGYPTLNDSDPDNEGAGSLVLSYRVSYLTSEANSANIRGVSLVDSTFSISAWSIGMLLFNAAWISGGSSIEKTSSDTLKVFVNHNINLL